MKLSQAVTIVFEILTRLADAVAQGEIEFRLSGSDVKSGRLEARHQGSWHVVDHNEFRWNTSQVACRQMGYEYTCRVELCTSLNGDEWVKSGCSKEYNTSIRLNIDCNGTEENISRCLKMTEAETFIINDGVSTDGVMITCAETEDVEVRLEGGIIESEGFLQVRCRQNGSWLVFCSSALQDHFDIRDGEVVCRHLKQKPLASIERRLFHGAEEVFSDSMFCGGNETHLLDCVFNEKEPFCQTDSGRWVIWVTCSIEISFKDEEVALCGSHHSCKNRCFSWSGTVNCKCDLACIEFGDCCYDFEILCGTNLTKGSKDTLAFPDTVLSRDYTCFGIEKISSKSYMVTKCLGSRDTVSRTAFELCESVTNQTDVLSQLPVFDSHGVVYKNVFCAICSGVRYSDVTAWSIKADKNTLDFEIVALIERNVTSLLALVGSELLEETKYLIQPPDPGDIGYPRWCATYLEPTCADITYTSSLFAPLFKLSDQFFESSNAWSYYYNPFAYMCDAQGRTLTREVCAKDLYICNHFFTKYDTCLRLSDGRDNEPSFITLLFDFSNTDSLAMEVVGTSCSGPGEIFDVFLGKCRFLSCPVGYEIHDGICSYAVRACIEDIVNIEWPYNSIHLSKFKENTYSVFLSARGVLSAMFLKMVMQRKLLHRSVSFPNNAICNVTLYVVGMEIVGGPECSHKPSPIFQPFNISEDAMPFFVYQLESNLSGAYQETSVLENCWKFFSGDLQCDSTNLKPIDFEIVDESSILDKDSGSLYAIDEIKVYMNGTIKVCNDEFSIILKKIVSVAHPLCFVISFGLLLFCFVVHVAFSNLRTLIRMCILNIIVSMFAINVVVFNNDYLQSYACTMASVISHFAWIYMFSWSTILISILIQSWNNRQRFLHMQDKRRKYLIIYNVTSFAFSGVVTIISVVLHHFTSIDSLTFGNGGVQLCWISDVKLSLWIPVGFLLFIDAIFFIATNLDFSKRPETNNHRAACYSSPPKDYRESTILFISVHGIALFGSLYCLIRHALLQLLFLTAFGTQSVFIFGAFVPIRKLLNMAQLQIRNYVHRFREASVENQINISKERKRGRAKERAHEEDKPQMMKQLDSSHAQ